MDIRHLFVFAIVAVEKILCVDPLCDKELIKGLPDNLLSASSSLSDPTLMTDPTRARLNSAENTLNNGTTYMGAWAPTVDGGGQYIQATFPDLTMVTGIQTQGRNQGTDHVTLFKIEYTLDGKNWETVNNDIGVEQIFMGNTDGDTIQDNPLVCPLFARGIRIVPLEWDKTTALRFEVNGCYLDNSIVVTTPSAVTQVPTVAVANSSSSFLPGIITPMGPTTPAAATIITTPTQSLVTTNPKTTVNLLTLIHWFMTHISNTTTPAVTTPITTLPSSTTTTTTTTTTTPPIAIKTTTPYIFMPGIQNPFGPSTRAFRPGILVG